MYVRTSNYKFKIRIKQFFMFVRTAKQKSLRTFCLSFLTKFEQKMAQGVHLEKSSETIIE